MFEGIWYFIMDQDKFDDKYNKGSAYGKDYYGELLKINELKEKGILSEMEAEEKIQAIKGKIEKLEKKH